LEIIIRYAQSSKDWKSSSCTLTVSVPDDGFQSFEL
jgi:hypothetical protein